MDVGKRRPCGVAMPTSLESWCAPSLHVNWPPEAPASPVCSSLLERAAAGPGAGARAIPSLASQALMLTLQIQPLL